MQDAVNLDAIERVRAGDATSLVAGLSAAGLQADELALLRNAIEHDEAQGLTSPGPELRGWLTGLRVKAAHGLSSVPARVIAQTVEPMVLRYAVDTGPRA